jgi:hypothetical protein
MLGPNAIHPATTALEVTPSETTVLQPGVRYLYVGAHGGGGGGGGGGGSGSNGDVTVQTVGGQTVTFANVPVGSYVFVQCTKVLATGTNATNILALI